MTSSDKSSSIAAFDEMLDRNQRELDALYSGPVSTTRSRSTGGDPSSSTPPAEPRFPAPSPAREIPDTGDSDSETVRSLNERYGDKWHYDVIDRRREGDEIIVLCKLSTEDDEISKAQFGSARIGDSGGSKTAGSASGVSFSFGSERSTQQHPAGDPADLAYQRAVDAALAKCTAML